MKRPLDELAAKRQLRELRSQWRPVLDNDVATLDADIAARLDAARVRALQAQAKPRWGKPVLWLAPAVAAMLAVVLWLPRDMNRDAALPQSIAPQLELSDAEPWHEDTDLLDELEFYTWLEMEAEHAS